MQVITMQTIGDQVKQIRTALGMTQQQLAERAGLSQSAIAEIEAGRRERMTLPTIQKLAAGLNSEFVPQLRPTKDIDLLREEQGTRVAQKIIAMTSGSSAIELQSPSPKSIERQIRELKEELLTRRDSTLWRKILSRVVPKARRRLTLFQVYSFP